MSAKKQQNPNIDFGFYATVPRLVRTDYREITPIQKWLYTCLKDLCGDTGTCYRTLRALSEETGISIGLLSESIPVLHKAGLIHAEKKKRSTGGKEVWHITIIDIWLANGKAHPSKRSQGEQTNQENVHNTNVQDVNIHNVNETSPECSPREPECSQILDRRKNTLSKNITEERIESLLSSDNPLTREEKIAEIEALLQELRSQSIPYQGNDQKGHASPTTVGQNDTSLTPAGNSTVPDGGNSPSLAQTPPDHTAIPEPHSNATDGLVPESPAMPCSETTPAESPLQPQEMPLSVPAHDESNRQATEQGKQANGVSDSQSTTKKSGKSTSGKGKGKGKEKVTQAPLIEEEEPEATLPQEPPAEMKWGTRKCLLLFDFWRGAPLLTDFKLMQASKCAKPLASYYTEDEVRLGKKRMDADDYYKKRGVDIMDVANNIQRYVKKKSHLSIVSTNSTTQEKRPIASTEGSQYIVDEIEDAALASIAAMEG